MFLREKLASPSLGWDTELGHLFILLFGMKPRLTEGLSSLAADLKTVKETKEMFVEKLQGGLNLTVCAHRIAAIYETYLQEGQTIQPHFHPDAEELYYLLSGNGIMHIGDEEREVEAGDVIYIPPDTVHFLHNSSEAPIRFITLMVRIPRAELMPYIQ